jgi:2-C-methyl-D-erythritol 4-phosphate cytidylyltransferase
MDEEMIGLVPAAGKGLRSGSPIRRSFIPSSERTGTNQSRSSFSMI